MLALVQAGALSRGPSRSRRTASIRGVTASRRGVYVGRAWALYDVVTQRLSGRHYDFADGRVEANPIEMRYAWPAELDLMARLAGMRLQHRWGGWRREPFTAHSPAHVSVYEKP